jgi:hypothetical protein
MIRKEYSVLKEKIKDDECLKEKIKDDECG